MATSNRPSSAATGWKTEMNNALARLRTKSIPGIDAATDDLEQALSMAQAMYDWDTPAGMQAISAYENLTVKVKRLESLAHSEDYDMNPECGGRLVKALEEIAEGIEQDTLRKAFLNTMESTSLAKYDSTLDALIQDIKASFPLSRSPISGLICDQADARKGRSSKTTTKSDPTAKSYNNLKKPRVFHTFW
ncbi:hypothetical protein MSAN_00841200 [Mycena sanguinolenta]|uniref:Uncharacterized protein n=1 Tax=Mycena sanguinolenta TaxID=230812 RepID=A0A8H6YZS6_9AGAR|nr:hypothetical protein MSAN_00841200 [Mycena sanguinolenta]